MLKDELVKMNQKQRTHLHIFYVSESYITVPIAEKHRNILLYIT